MVFGLGKKPMPRGGSRKGIPNKPASERLAMAQLREQRKRDRELRQWQLEDPEGFAAYQRAQRQQWLSSVTNGKPGALDTETVERVIRYLNTIGMEVRPKGSGRRRGDEEEGTLAEIIELAKMVLPGAPAVFANIQTAAQQQLPAAQTTIVQQPQPPAPQPQPQLVAPASATFAPAPADVTERLRTIDPPIIGDYLIGGIAGKTPAAAAAWLLDEAGKDGSAAELIRQFLPKAASVPEFGLAQVLGLIGKQDGWGSIAAYATAQLDLTKQLLREAKAQQQQRNPSL